MRKLIITSATIKAIIPFSTLKYIVPTVTFNNIVTRTTGNVFEIPECIGTLCDLCPGPMPIALAPGFPVHVSVRSATSVLCLCLCFSPAQGTDVEPTPCYWG